MKKLITAILPILAISLAAPTAVAGNDVVLVELFTSQGCSSCPPADRNLAALEEREDVLGLSLHIDYWDYLGWRDTFARPEFTERQFVYRDLMDARVVYTPQMVVQGAHDVPGSRKGRMEAAIDRALAAPRSARITIASVSGMLKATLAPTVPAVPCTIWMASFSRAESVEIALGENAGERLTYSNVVDKLMRVGPWDGGRQEISLPQPAPGEGVAIWLQDDRTGRILTASYVDG